MNGESSVAPAVAVTPPVEPAEWRLPDRGRVGMACLILTESTFFAIFVVAYLYYVGRSLNGPYPRDVIPPIYLNWLVLLNSICLFSSSYTVHRTVKGLAANELATFKLWLLLTILLGLEFLAGTAYEWYELIYEEGLTIGTNLFGTTFYSLVGFHALHVTVGLMMLSLVLVLGVLGFVKSMHAARVEILSWYWHLVDAVWVVVFTTVYIVGRF
jgi:cytochrome c oxidase subunit 3